MKFKKSITLAVSVLTLSAVLLTGCGKKSPAVTTPPVSAAPTATTQPAEQGDSIMSVAELVGKTDEEAKELFGGGSENKTEDGSVLLGRSYTVELDGKAAVIETIYTEDLKVSAATVTFDNATAPDVESIITAACGEPTKVSEQENIEASYLRWTKDGIAVSLYDSYGMVSVEFTQANG